MRGNRSFYFLALALAPLLFVLHAPERGEVLHQASLTLLRPFLEISHFISEGIHETQDSLSQFWALYRAHGALVQRVEELEQKQVEMEELQKENERLRKLLDFKQTLPSKTIAARVIGWDLAPWRRTVLIDKGTHQGIHNRMAVVNAQGLVGRVIEAGAWSSRVILLLDTESRVSVLFQGSRDLAVAEGDGSSLLHVTHIDRQSTIKVGDSLISSGFGGVYPKGISVGTVEMVGTEKDGLELFSVARPYVNFSKLEEVLCVSSSPEDS